MFSCWSPCWLLPLITLRWTPSTQKSPWPSLGRSEGLAHLCLGLSAAPETSSEKVTLPNAFRRGGLWGDFGPIWGWTTQAYHASSTLQGKGHRRTPRRFALNNSETRETQLTQKGGNPRPEKNRSPPWLQPLPYFPRGDQRAAARCFQS